MNAKVPNKATNPSASVSLCTLKFVAPTTTITSRNNVEQNTKVPSTATNSTIPISSQCASGSPSTSKFVTLSTTVTLPTGHPTGTNIQLDIIQLQLLVHVQVNHSTPLHQQSHYQFLT